MSELKRDLGLWGAVAIVIGDGDAHVIEAHRGHGVAGPFLGRWYVA